MAYAKEYLHETMDEWDTVFDPPIKCEYNEEQLIRFAEMWADIKVEEFKLKTKKNGKNNMRCHRC